jgi:hypothetical protein
MAQSLAGWTAEESSDLMRPQSVAPSPASSCNFCSTASAGLAEAVDPVEDFLQATTNNTMQTSSTVTSVLFMAQTL